MLHSSRLLAIAITRVGLPLMLCTLATSIRAAQLRYLAALPLTDKDHGRSASEIALYLRLSVSDVNTQLAGPAGHSVFVDFRDTAGSIARGSQHVFNSTLPSVIPNTTSTTNGAIAMITGITSDNTIPLTLLAQAQGMYVCSGSATATKLSNMAIFGQSFFRTIAADDVQGVALAHYLKHQQWNACAVFASNSKYGRSIATAFGTTAAALEIDLVSTEFISFSSPASESKSFLLSRAVSATAEAGVRIIVFLGTLPEFLELAPVARQSGILGAPNWVWIVSEAVGEITVAVQSDPSLQAFTDGLQIVFPEEIVDRQMEQNLLGRAQRRVRRLRGDTAMEPYAGFYRDCLFGLTAMFIDMMKPGGSGIRETDVLSRRSHIPVRKALRSFNGITGRVTFDEEGRRMSAFNVLSLFRGNATAVFRVDTGVPGGRVTQLATPQYFDGSSIHPPTRPEEIVQFVRFRSFSGVFAMGVTACIALVILWWTALLVRHRHHAIVKEHKLSVLICVALGLLMILAGSLGWMDVQSRMSCTATKWVMSLGLHFTIIPLLYRAYLYWSAFDNPRMWPPQPTPAMSATFACISTVTPLILTLRTIVAPLKPVPFSTLTSFSFKCRSEDMLFYYLFNYLYSTWTLGLYLALLYFSFALRLLRRPGNTSSCTHLGVVNLGLTTLAVSPLMFLRIPGFALGSYWTHVVAVWYACGVLATMTHGRLVQIMSRSESPSQPTASGSRGNNPTPGFSVSPGVADATSTMALVGASGRPLAVPSSTQLGLPAILSPTAEHILGRQQSLPRLIPAPDHRSQGLARVEGKPLSYIGDFPIKYCVGVRQRHVPLVPFLSTWHTRRVFITFEDGYIGVHCKGRDHGTTGHIWVLPSITISRSPLLDKVLQVYAFDRPVFLVQCEREEHVWEWIRMFPRRVQWDEKNKDVERQDSFYGRVVL